MIILISIVLDMLEAIYVMHHNQENPIFDPVCICLHFFSNLCIYNLHSHVSPDK